MDSQTACFTAIQKSLPITTHRIKIGGFPATRWCRWSPLWVFTGSTTRFVDFGMLCLKIKRENTPSMDGGNWAPYPLPGVQGVPGVNCDDILKQSCDLRRPWRSWLVSVTTGTAGMSSESSRSPSLPAPAGPARLMPRNSLYEHQRSPVCKRGRERGHCRHQRRRSGDVRKQLVALQFKLFAAARSACAWRASKAACEARKIFRKDCLRDDQSSELMGCLRRRAEHFTGDPVVLGYDQPVSTRSQLRTRCP